MSDDRFTREPGDDEEPYEPHADRTHIDPKPRSWYNKAPTAAFDLAAERPPSIARAAERAHLPEPLRAAPMRARSWSLVLPPKRDERQSNWLARPANAKWIEYPDRDLFKGYIERDCKKL